MLLISWKGFVQKYPGRALLTAAGLGMAASAFLANLTSSNKSMKESHDA